jgi:non-ribosomal peptide synthetase component E (peptide arylation enzyme)
MPYMPCTAADAAVVEAALRRHPDVGDAVIDVSHCDGRELVTAIVVARSSALTLDSVRRHLSRHGVPGRGMPSQLAMVPALPHLESGEVARAQVRRWVCGKGTLAGG